MELVARGYNRDHGDNVIARRDLSDARHSYGGYVRPAIYMDTTEGKEDSPYGLRVVEKGNVELRFFAKVALNGEYLFRQTLTRKDIIKLFLAAHDNCSLNELIEVLSEVKDSHPNRDYPSIMQRRVKDIGMPDATAKWLNDNHIRRVGDLVQKSEYQLSKLPNMPSEYAVQHISNLLMPYGLSLGMLVKNWSPVDDIYYTKLDDLEFSVRTANCLKNEGLVYIGDLVQKTEAELLRTPNFGRKSVMEVKAALAEYDLHLNMDLPKWRSPDAA